MVLHDQLLVGKLSAAERTWVEAGGAPAAVGERSDAGSMRCTEYGPTDTLDGGEGLPGFTCPVADFFA